MLAEFRGISVQKRLQQKSSAEKCVWKHLKRKFLARKCIRKLLQQKILAESRGIFDSQRFAAQGFG